MNVKKLNHAVESLRHSLKENDADPRTFQAADKVWDAIDILDKKVSVLKRVAKSKWDKTEVDQMENLLDKFRDAVENVLMANDPDMQEGEKIQERDASFFLNGDGMTNAHPGIDSEKSSGGKYHFKMSDRDFKNYLKKHDLYLRGKKILDQEDDYEYGSVG